MDAHADVMELIACVYTDINRGKDMYTLSIFIIEKLIVKGIKVLIRNSPGNFKITPNDVNDCLCFCTFIA